MEVFIEISFLLIITTFVATIVRLLKQPLVVGYILSGIVVGPYLLNLLNSGESIELFSKIGITILLFIVGLSLNPETIKETGKPSLITGVGQIVFTAGIGFFIIKLLGYNNISSIYGAIALTFSSTIIVLKLLSDKGDLNSLYGKVSIGFLLVQDIVATILLIIVPLVGAVIYTSNGDGLVSIWPKFLKLFISGTVISFGLYVISKYILPKFSDYLAKSSELLFLFTVSWGLVLATLFHNIGFSIEIGALIAGVTLSASKYSYEISSRMKPLRDFFIVLFFVLLGSKLVLLNISTLILPAIILSLFVLIGNPLIVFVIMNLLGYKNRTSFMAGLTVAQISEFSLILIALGFELGHLDQNIVTLITLVGIITITGSTYMFLYADKIYYFIKNFLKYLMIFRRNKEGVNIEQNFYDMVIFGFGRVGYGFVLKAKENNLKYLAVDYNPNITKIAQENSISYSFGDAGDVEFLEEINLKNSKIVVSTIPDLETNKTIVSFCRDHNKDCVCVVIAHNLEELKDLYSVGATYVILPHYLGAQHAADMVSTFVEDQDVFIKAKHVQNIQIDKFSF